MSTEETPASSSMPSIEPIDEHGSTVRFETQCVIIPDSPSRPRRPRVVTKSYALPLWKRRPSTSPSAPATSPLIATDISGEENQSHLVLRVPLPTLSLEPRSPTRTVDCAPLPPCLVHRPHLPDTSYPHSSTLTRHPRSAQKKLTSPIHPDIVTVPLRPCCAACYSVTEAAFVDGDAWQERFSRAASRRRSQSASDSPRTLTVAGSAASASYGALGVSISVDEIDKRRRSGDVGALIDMVRSDPSMAAAHSPSCITPTTPRIPEEEDSEDEDENELFPLPSPKRTPSVSPAPSLAGSSSSMTQSNDSFVTCPSPTGYSGDNVTQRSGKQQCLTPPPCSFSPPPCSFSSPYSFSSSSLSLPQLPGSTIELLRLIEDFTRAPSPDLLSTLPSISRRSRPPSPDISPIPPASMDMLPCTAGRVPPELPQCPKTLPVPIPVMAPAPKSMASSAPSNNLHRSPSAPPSTRFSWRSRRGLSMDGISAQPFSPPTSHALSTSSNMKHSTSILGRRHIITDVLRGVGAIGTGGLGL
ncbi:hypothetical protein JVU11DRAFT_12827 [Chiua virens]|nr:hypothetical protein JVU11DRAFT_12827 [Chiua virens]